MGEFSQNLLGEKQHKPEKRGFCYIFANILTVWGDLGYWEGGGKHIPLILFGNVMHCEKYPHIT